MSHWEEDTTTLEDARYTVWSEPDYAGSVGKCISLLIPDLKLRPGDRVLDLGCGIGRLTIPLAQSRQDVTVVGYDTSRAMIDWAIHESADVPNVQWQHGGDLPECDAAFSIVVFQHLNPAMIQDYLTQVGQVLTPGRRFRFQYVQGNHHSDYDHRYDEWLPQQITDAGLITVRVDRGLWYDEWVWITCERPQ